jgi:hypothetical protein
MTSGIPIHEAPETVQLQEDSNHGKLSAFLGILKRLTISAGEMLMFQVYWSEGYCFSEAIITGTTRRTYSQSGVFSHCIAFLT